MPPVVIDQNKEELLQTWAYTYTRAVRQRTVRQETTMAKMGTLPHYIYSSRINEVIEATEEYNIENHTKPQSSHVSQNNEQTPAEQSDQEQCEENRCEPEPPDQFDEDGSDDPGEERPQIAANVENALDEGTYFLVGRSSRFGRAIKINSKLFS